MPVTVAASKTVEKSRRGLPKAFCGARTSSGGRCGLRRGWGTDHPGYGRCKLHGGSSPSGRKHAGRQELEDFMGAASPLLDVDPIEALLYTVRRASAIASWLRLRVEAVEQEEQLQSGELNPWGALERDSLGDLAKFSKMALDAGVAERRVRIAEQTGALIAQAMEDALADVDLPPGKRAQFVKTFAARLRVLEATHDPDSLLEAA